VHEALAPYAEADPDRTAQVMPVISHLLLGLPLTEEHWSEEKRRTATHVWRPVQVRGVHVGDTVRVKHDAYPRSTNLYADNGRVGKVSALRGGIIVMYDDVVNKSTSMGTRHPPEKLEVQVPIPRRVTQ
jgi:hypothetical protein